MVALSVCSLLIAFFVSSTPGSASNYYYYQRDVKNIPSVEIDHYTDAKRKQTYAYSVFNMKKELLKGSPHKDEYEFAVELCKSNTMLMVGENVVPRLLSINSAGEARHIAVSIRKLLRFKDTYVDKLLLGLYPKELLQIGAAVLRTYIGEWIDRSSTVFLREKGIDVDDMLPGKCLYATYDMEKFVYETCRSIGNKSSLIICKGRMTADQAVVAVGAANAWLAAKSAENSTAEKADETSKATVAPNVTATWAATNKVSDPPTRSAELSGWFVVALLTLVQLL